MQEVRKYLFPLIKKIVVNYWRLNGGEKKVTKTSLEKESMTGTAQQNIHSVLEQN